MDLNVNIDNNFSVAFQKRLVSIQRTATIYKSSLPLSICLSLSFSPCLICKCNDFLEHADES